MISQDDIDAFAADNGAALDAAGEYVRRAEKGLPPDRWADGTAGALLVAKGIAAQSVIIAALTDAVAQMAAAGFEARRISMGLGDGND